MPVSLRHQDGNIYRVEIRGILRSREFEQCQKELAREMSRIGAVRLLVILDGFEGWEPRDNWRDLSFYLKHGDAVERIAIVGEDRWCGRMLMFAAADLRKAAVEFFPEDALANASGWLSESAGLAGGM